MSKDYVVSRVDMIELVVNLLEEKVISSDVQSVVDDVLSFSLEREVKAKKIIAPNTLESLSKEEQDTLSEKEKFELKAIDLLQTLESNFSENLMNRYWHRKRSDLTQKNNLDITSEPEKSVSFTERYLGEEKEKSNTSGIRL